MSDEPALLAAIRAHPDEDTPRLIYADWLDENGQPERAEFIRLQCLPEPSEEQEGRAFDLEEQNRGRWLAQLSVPQFAEARWQFRRGFPERLQTDDDTFFEQFEAFARVSWLRSVFVYDLSPWDVRDLAGRTWPAQWQELELSLATSFNAASAFDALAGCAQLAQLRRLRLWASDLDEDAARALAASPHLARVQRFELSRADTRDRSFFALLRERFGDRLVID